MRTQQMAIESVIFADARRDFNEAMRRLLMRMETAKTAEGSVCLRIDIEMTKEYYASLLPDGRTAEQYEATVPRFKYRAYSTVKAKDEIKGEMRPELEIVFNEQTKEYELRHAAAGQMTVYNYDEEEEESNWREG